MAENERIERVKRAVAAFEEIVAKKDGEGAAYWQLFLDLAKKSDYGRQQAVVEFDPASIKIFKKGLKKEQRGVLLYRELLRGLTFTFGSDLQQYSIKNVSKASRTLTRIVYTPSNDSDERSKAVDVTIPW